MDFAILLLALPGFIFVAVILYSLYRAKENCNALVKVASKFGFEKFRRIWISEVILQGKVDNFDATLEGSFDANGASLTLRLQNFLQLIRFASGNRVIF